MKEVQIIPPDGYEIDKEKSTFEKIVFKEKAKSEKPKDWYEFCNNTPVDEEYYIDDGSIVQTFTNDNRSIYEKNLCKTYEEAKAFLALIQLRRLWNEWKDEPGDDYICKMYFWYNEQRDEFEVVSDCSDLPLMFYSTNNANKFLKCFKGLFDEVKILYKTIK